MKRFFSISLFLISLFFIFSSNGCGIIFTFELENKVLFQYPNKNLRDSDSINRSFLSESEYFNLFSLKKKNYNYFDDNYLLPRIGFSFYYPSPYTWDNWYPQSYRYFDSYYFWDSYRPFYSWRHYHDRWNWWNPWPYYRYDYRNDYWNAPKKPDDRFNPGERRKDGGVRNNDPVRQKDSRDREVIKPDRRT